MLKSRWRLTAFVVLTGLLCDAVFIATGFSRFSVLELVTNIIFSVIFGLSAYSMRAFVDEGYRKQAERRRAAGKTT